MCNSVRAELIHVLKDFKRVRDRYPHYWRYSKVWRHQPLPNLPLVSVAEKWKIKITCIPASRDADDGIYVSWKNHIILTSTEEIVFFNALSRAGLERLEYENLNPYEEEIIAELSAQTLFRMVGTRTYACFGNTYGVIERNAERLQCSPVSAVRKYMRHAEQVVQLILNERRND